jgi:hypothetical protein
VIDTRSLRAAHSRFLATHRAAVSTELRLAAEIGVAEVQRKPGFTRRTGATQAATTSKVVRTRSGGVVRLRNTKGHARTLEGGSKPHVIRARSAKALRFIGKGGLVFRKSVNHPGTKPYRFLSRARDQASGSFHRGMSRRMAEIARRF